MLIPKKSGVYKILNIINNKVYIGSAKNLFTRKYRHFYNLKNGTHHNKFLQNSFIKFGIENFSFEVLEICEKQNLIAAEQKWLDLFFDGQIMCYNINEKAYSWLGRKHSEISKEKMAESHTGKKFTKETRKKMSISHTGKKHSKNTKDKISAASRERQKIPKNCPQWGKVGKNSANKRKVMLVLKNGTKKIFYTVKNAAKFAGVNPSTITRAIKNRNGKVKNYIFIFLEPRKNNKHKNNFERKNRNSKKVSVLNICTKEKYIFDTIKQAAKFIGSPESSISRSIHTKDGKIRNFIVSILVS